MALARSSESGMSALVTGDGQFGSSTHFLPALLSSQNAAADAMSIAVKSVFILLNLLIKFY